MRFKRRVDYAFNPKQFGFPQGGKPERDFAQRSALQVPGRKFGGKEFRRINLERFGELGNDRETRSARPRFDLRDHIGRNARSTSQPLLRHSQTHTMGFDQFSEPVT
nr:hypothetical protein [Stakelama pacifica]